ncbi:MAG: 50S ribosomal protein L24 [Pseudomonadota bacterium]
MSKIRKGDEVIVIAGKDKGKRGLVLLCLDSGYVVVGGVNRVKKHVKPNPGKNVAGGIVEKDMPIHLSNVSIFNSKTQRAGRVGFTFLENGTKVRVFKSSGEVVGA